MFCYSSIVVKQGEPCSSGRKKEEDLSKKLELQITGAEKPSIWELVGIRLILLPYTIGKVRFCPSEKHCMVWKLLSLVSFLTCFFCNFCHCLLIALYFCPSSYPYGGVAGSGDTMWNKLHILGRTPVTWHRDPWECLLMHGEILVIIRQFHWLYGMNNRKVLTVKCEPELWTYHMMVSDARYCLLENQDWQFQGSLFTHWHTHNKPFIACHSFVLLLTVNL